MTPFLTGAAVVLGFNLLFYVLVARRIEDLPSRLASFSAANVVVAIFGFVMGMVCRAHVGAWYC